MFDFIFKIFIGLITSILIAFKHTECVYKSNQKSTTQCILNNEYNEYTKVLHYYPFAVNLDRCVIITELNETKILTKHLTCKM